MGRRSKIIRPFGLLSGRYEVSGWSLWLYQASCWLAAALVLSVVIVLQSEYDGGGFWAVFCTGLCIVGATSIALTRLGQKLDS